MSSESRHVRYSIGLISWAVKCHQANNSDNADNPKNLNKPFDLHELRRALREVKKQSAPGADKISYEMLQKLPKCATKAVLKLYNQIWINDDFPVGWRHSIVLPVLKPGRSKKCSILSSC